MNRKDFQRVAETRLSDAQALLKARRYDGAYYLAGYAVECALKACIAKATKRHDFPDKKFANKVHIHDLTELRALAGLDASMEREFHNDPSLEVKWVVVKDWSEQSRYEVHGGKKANDMVNAVADRAGILTCIRKYW